MTQQFLDERMKILSIGLVLIFLVVSESAFAIRCNNKVVSKGDSQYRFYKLCGEPDFVQKKVMYISNSITARHSDAPRYHSHEELTPTVEHQQHHLNSPSTGQTVKHSAKKHLGRDTLEYRHKNEKEVQIETWTYDFGSNRLVQEIRFVDGVAVSIKNRGYGTD